MYADQKFAPKLQDLTNQMGTFTAICLILAEPIQTFTVLRSGLLHTLAQTVSLSVRGHESHQ